MEASSQTLSTCSNCYHLPRTISPFEMLSTCEYASFNHAPHHAPRPGTAGYLRHQKFTSSIPSLTYSTFTADCIPSRTTSASQEFTTRAHQDYGIPHLTKTPWEQERHKRNSIRRRRKLDYPLPGHIFKRLPREVYDCVVEQLEQLHFGQDEACPSCYLKDLYNLSLTSRAWDRATTLQMYRKVWVLTNEDAPKMPKLKIRGTSRLKLLRRTLRGRPAWAQHVRELNMSDFQVLYQNASIEREEIVNLVASLVMACPNLERLVGFHVPYTHVYDRLSHALSTRTKLKERVWLLAENEDLDLYEDEEEDPTSMYYQAERDPTERFLELNSNHSNLTTLILHQEQADPTIPLTFRAVIGSLRQFPVLRHLSISGLSATCFTNLALNALPLNLQSLRLQDLPGINDKGLQRFASSRLSTSLSSLMLINLEISDLVTVSKFMSAHLRSLQRFSLSQYATPSLPTDAPIPELKSDSLTYVHWELRSQAILSPPHPYAFSHLDTASIYPTDQEPPSCLATSTLATNILASNFPSLRSIRAPHDPQGALQALCHPLATALLPSDTTLVASIPRTSITRSDSTATSTSSSLHSPRSPPRSDSPMSSTSSFTHHPPTSSKPLSLPLPLPLHTPTPLRSRLAAQSRILAGRRAPNMQFRVTDAKGRLRIDKRLGGYIGDVRSGIAYELRPDRSRVVVGAPDAEPSAEYGVDDDGGENEWIAGVGDVVGEWEIVGGRTGAGCGHVASGSASMGRVRVGDMF
ncbi:hypothetical protein BDV95DRAFT_38823 [Massariosphaeria phaeospora]|uniref:F-box domain-containing protein n=1 Tax=Massariosphaeria phaeospora TaxID=100035 RepID=A0A7C8IEL0_9PLEO|nr:hypothetical protein BDV95DRAFT_38823 [Massariosphaeria phaeospora]